MSDQIIGDFKANEVGTTQPIPIYKIPASRFDAEYAVKGDDLYIHIFVKGRPEPCEVARKDYWQHNDQQIFHAAFVSAFGLQSEVERVKVDFIRELYSWCIRIKRVAVVSIPDVNLLSNALAAAAMMRINDHANYNLF